MKRTVIILLATSSYLLAQDTRMLDIQAGGPGGVVGWSAIEKTAGPPVVGAPYSATISNESIQTLADGNRIAESSTGTTARDSQGRTRRDATLPAIGNLSAANAPRLVFIQDPVAQTPRRQGFRSHGTRRARPDEQPTAAARNWPAQNVRR